LTLKYRSGKQNGAADALSRLHECPELDFKVMSSEEVSAELNEIVRSTPIPDELCLAFQESMVVSAESLEVNQDSVPAMGTLPSYSYQELAELTPKEGH